MQLEQSDTPRELGAEYAKLGSWVAPHLRKSFALWLRAAMRRRGLREIDLPEIDDFEELGTMVAENMLEYFEREKRQAVTEAAANVVVRLARRKFGTLDAATQKRLEAADEATLLRCADRILTARDVHDLFRDE